MNRDIIESGKTGGKWAESFALFGGIGSMVYPLTFYYVAYVALTKRIDFTACKIKEEFEKETKGEDVDDWIRFTMLWNCNMMSIYLVLHYLLFSRTESYRRFKRIGYAFAIVLCIEIIFALFNFILIGISICNDEDFATAGIISSVVIILVNLVTIIASTIYFLVKTRTRTSQISVEASDRSALIKDSDQTKIQPEPAKEPEKPTPPPEVDELEEEDAPPPVVDDGGIE